MALRMYDINSDGMRDVTQRDVDLMQATVNAYGRLRTMLEDVHAEYRAKVAEIDERYQRQAMGEAAVQSLPEEPEQPEE